MECKKCRSLYYIANKGLCQRIFDPDCEISDGVSSVCQRCKNGEIFKSLYYIGIICNSNLCSSIDPATGQCSECLNGYVLTEVTAIDLGKYTQDYEDLAFKVKNIKLNYIKNFLSFFIYFFLHHNNFNSQCVEKAHYCLGSDSLAKCLHCEEGQYLKQHRYRKSICLKIPIENCIIFDQKNHVCSKCKEGYDLLQSGLCFKLSRCLKYHTGGCLECSKEFFLKDGICIKISNCIDQLMHQCSQCASGYWVRKESKNIQRTIGDTKIY